MLAELTEVRKQYGNFQLNCTMQLEEGRITGLIGKNGAGKSTAFKAILGLIHVDYGTVQYRTYACTERGNRGRAFRQYFQRISDCKADFIYHGKNVSQI